MHGIRNQGPKYRSNKLNTFEQLKVSRKLLPVLSGLLGEIKVFMQLQSGQITIEDAIKTALPAIVQTLSNMIEEDSNAILHPCLAVVLRQQGSGYVAIFANGYKMMAQTTTGKVDVITQVNYVAQSVEITLDAREYEFVAAIFNKDTGTMALYIPRTRNLQQIAATAPASTGAAYRICSYSTSGTAVYAGPNTQSFHSVNSVVVSRSDIDAVYASTKAFLATRGVSI